MAVEETSVVCVSWTRGDEKPGKSHDIDIIINIIAHGRITRLTPSIHPPARLDKRAQPAFT